MTSKVSNGVDYITMDEELTPLFQLMTWYELVSEKSSEFAKKGEGVVAGLIPSMVMEQLISDKAPIYRMWDTLDRASPTFKADVAVRREAKALGLEEVARDALATLPPGAIIVATAHPGMPAPTLQRRGRQRRRRNKAKKVEEDASPPEPSEIEQPKEDDKERAKQNAETKEEVIDDTPLTIIGGDRGDQPVVEKLQIAENADPMTFRYYVDDSVPKDFPELLAGQSLHALSGDGVEGPNGYPAFDHSVVEDLIAVVGGKWAVLPNTPKRIAGLIRSLRRKLPEEAEAVTFTLDDI
uniref:Uncharacterized protein n=1 Tax=viral metagenome TaxID=1070528 RepID=A0A2V0RIK0_9ZZZZ